MLVLFFLLCSVPISAILLTRTPVLKSVALSAIEQALNCEAKARSVRLSGTGTLTFEQLELSNPAIGSDASTFFYAEQLDVRPEWTSLTGNAVRFQRVQVREPIITLSIDELNQLNIKGISAPSGGAAAAYPDVTFTNATFQFAEHSDTEFQTLATINMQGKLLADRGKPRIHNLLLEQINLKPNQSQATLAGTIDSRTGELDLRLENVDIQQWSKDAAPSHLRDLWERMNVRGRIDTAELQLDPRDSTLTTTITPQGVTLALPIKLPEGIYQNSPCGLTPEQATEFIELTDVTGTLKFTNVEQDGESPAGLLASVTGELQGVQAQVELEYRGTELDSPFSTQIVIGPTAFANPCEIISFAPEIAVEIYERFAGREGTDFVPTGTIAASVALSRDQIGDEIDYSGRVDIGDGRARFETVPYLFESVNGAVTFDRERVEILPFTAVAPTGATLFVDGDITPPGDGAEVNINIRVNNVPVNQEFIESLPVSRQPLVDSIINYREYERLLREGFIQDPTTRALRLAEYQRMTDGIRQLQRINPNDPDVPELIRKAELVQQQAELPVFELDGMAQLDVTVHRSAGLESTYETSIYTELIDIALLPEQFPYPVTADQIDLDILPDRIVLSPAVLSGISGAEGSIEGVVLVGEDGVSNPNVLINAGDVPVDALLIQALPGEPYREPTAFPFKDILPLLDPSQLEIEDEGPIEFSVQRFLTRLNVDGTVHASTKLHQNSLDPGLLGFTTTVTLADLTASPVGSTHPLESLSGVLTVTDSTLNATDMSATIDDANIQASISAHFPERSVEANPVTELSVELSALGIDIRQRFEAFLHTIEPARAIPVIDLRRRFEPSGKLDAKIDFSLTGEQTEFEIEMTNAKCVRYNAFGGRLSITQTGSTPMRAVLTQDRVKIEHSEGVYRFLQLSGTDADDALDLSAPQGGVRIQGDYPIIDLESDAHAGDLRIDMSKAAFESEFVRNVSRVVAPALADWLNETDFGGIGDANIRIQAMSPTEPKVTGTLKPFDIALTRRGERIEFNDLEASIELDGGGGEVEILSGTHEDVPSIAFAGEWLRDIDRGVPFGVRGTLTADITTLSDPVLAALPIGAEDAIRAMELSGTTDLSVRDGRIEYLVPPSQIGDEPMSGFSGRVFFDGAGFTAGVRFTDAVGEAYVDVRSSESMLSPDVRVDASIAEVSLDPVSFTNVSLSLISPQDDPSIYVPRIEATAYGGVASGNASVFTSLDPTSTPTFAIDLGFTNVDTATMLVDLGVEEDAADPLTMYERGVLDAALSIKGTVGEIQSRRGRLVIRGQPFRQWDSTNTTQQYTYPGSAIIDIPQIRLVVNAVLATSKPPFVVPAIATLVGAPSEPIDFAYADANIIGPRIAFSDISLETRSVAIRGAGDITLPEQSLNLTFTTFELEQIPILSEWIRGVRDQFIAVEITGTIEEPEIDTRFFKAGSEFLDAIFLGREPRRIGQDRPPSSPQPGRRSGRR